MSGLSGSGKTWLADSSKAMNYLVGGWQLSNTTNWSSGLPWTPSFGECGPEEDVGICRPNKGSGSFHTGVSGSINPDTHTLTYFTPVALGGAFTDPGSGNLGNIGRNGFHGPSGFYSDLSMVKKFKLYERLTGQFRMDAFNVFNHPVYAFSQNNGASATQASAQMSKSAQARNQSTPATALAKHRPYRHPRGFAQFPLPPPPVRQALG